MPRATEVDNMLQVRVTRGKADRPRDKEGAIRLCASRAWARLRLGPHGGGGRRWQGRRRGRYCRVRRALGSRGVQSCMRGQPG